MNTRMKIKDPYSGTLREMRLVTCKFVDSTLHKTYDYLASHDVGVGDFLAVPVKRANGIEIASVRVVGRHAQPQPGIRYVHAIRVIFEDELRYVTTEIECNPKVGKTRMEKPNHRPSCDDECCC